MKKRSLSTVKKELDRVFSEFIRKRDADLDGYITCVSCKKKVHWKD
ncbi:recombinase, partial [bacterium]|nr:recombinase [bacterium]